MDETLKGAIEAAVNRHYERYEGPATVSVTLVRNMVDGRLDRQVSRNEVEVACDALVEEGRLVFLRDHGRDGRLYCSPKVPEATVEVLRESVE